MNKPSHTHHPPQPPPHYPQHHPPPPPRPQYPHPPAPPHRPPKPPKPRRTTLASCIVATIFLTFLVILLFILYFSLFKPKDPKITITAIEIPTFTVSPNSTTVSFTFSQYAAVHNPNRAAFHHFDSSLQLLYAGNQVAFMFIPAGNISAGSTVYMSATFSVKSFPIMSGNVPAMEMPVVSDGFDRVQPTMEMEVRMEMVGRVRVLWFFTHHVESLADCRLQVAINGGSVFGFHC
ncbi:hypothetical protein RND81_13G058800 [Saponaria officinalis]|uniref:Late embryogenesis abundant protein LEA-2 subgroup domain-containing protein n=1 Tax=Saponaria officinalis TaxID=3572 RepID=A0AAW1GUM5_SAPOF